MKIFCFLDAALYLDLNQNVLKIHKSFAKYFLKNENLSSVRGLRPWILKNKLRVEVEILGK